MSDGTTGIAPIWWTESKALEQVQWHSGKRAKAQGVFDATAMRVKRSMKIFEYQKT